MRDLSVIIPARNEEFLKNTVESVLANKRADTEVIVFADGYSPKLDMHPDLVILHASNPVGQRAAINRAVEISTGKYIMKLDAHCAVDVGFDMKLIARGNRYEDTIVPSMYELHAFDWLCVNCGTRTFQGPEPDECDICRGVTFARVIVFDKGNNPPRDYWRIGRNLTVIEDKKRSPSRQVLEDIMCHLGCCFFMRRTRFHELGGMDENHGSYGQMGVEIACKAWLSGGRLVLNRSTWFAHITRNQAGFMHPYALDGKQVMHAINYSRDLWQNDKWPLAARKFNWLIERFR